VTPADLRDLFVASAGVAGALIGLLFVAISVEHERLTADDADQVHRVRASAALTAFVNALGVSLFALLPSDLGGTASVVSVLGLLFVAASLLSLRRATAVQTVAPRDAGFLIGLIVVFALQLWAGLRLLVNGSDPGAADTLGILVIVCFFIGIARAWELVGGPQIGIGREVRTLLRARGGGDRPVDDGHRRARLRERR
jgi:hypothetical protein